MAQGELEVYEESTLAAAFEGCHAAAQLYRIAQEAHTFSEFEAVEVDQKPDWHIEQLHATQKLGLVDWQHFSHSLGFYQDTALHEHVKA